MTTGEINQVSRALGNIEGKIDKLPDTIAASIAAHKTECRGTKISIAPKLQEKMNVKLVGAIVALAGLVVWLVKG